MPPLEDHPEEDIEAEEAMLAEMTSLATNITLLRRGVQAKGKTAIFDKKQRR